MNFHPARRTVLASASAVSLALTAVATGAVIAAHHDVLLEVDGVTRPVDGFFLTVGGALSRADVELGAHDLVAPATDSKVTDGQTIVVRTAKPYDVVVEGETVTAWSTADSIDGVLTSISPSGTVVIAADRSQLRREMPVVTADELVFINVDGAAREVSAAAGDTVDVLLKKASVTLGEFDTVDVVSEGGTSSLKVTRITRGKVDVATPIPFDTEERADDTIYEGQQRVVQEGQEGSTVTTYYRHTVDGKIVINMPLAKTTTDPVTRIVAVGTKEKPKAQAAPAAAVSGDVPEVWAALARCESGGNPATNTGNGYYGMYQFSLPTWISVGGSGLPSEASAQEQTMRAQMLQARSGWGQWPACSAALGLR